MTRVRPTRKHGHAQRPRHAPASSLQEKVDGPDRALSARQAARLHEAALPRPGRLLRAGLRDAA
ncbi:MAG: hypothetical protein MZV70_40890 [Desulfobacterales bacterium]|nr:hypothetical protein [Desulfobacterales bacterium]